MPSPDAPALNADSLQRFFSRYPVSALVVPEIERLEWTSPISFLNPPPFCDDRVDARIKITVVSGRTIDVASATFEVHRSKWCGRSLFRMDRSVAGILREALLLAAKEGLERPDLRGVLGLGDEARMDRVAGQERGGR